MQSTVERSYTRKLKVQLVVSRIYCTNILENKINFVVARISCRGTRNIINVGEHQGFNWPKLGQNFEHFELYRYIAKDALFLLALNYLVP